MLLIILSHLNSIDDKRNYPLGNFKHILFYFNSFPPELSTALTESAVRQSGKAHIFSLIGFFSLKQPVDSEIPERAIGFSLRANPTISNFIYAPLSPISPVMPPTEKGRDPECHQIPNLAPFLTASKFSFRV